MPFAKGENDELFSLFERKKFQKRSKRACRSTAGEEWILSRKSGKLCEDARRAHSPLAESGGALSDVTRFFGGLHLAATLRIRAGCLCPISDSPNP